jgi:KDO2-lipid IV(A) lauroyltransferase
MKDLLRWCYWFPFRRLVQAAPEAVLGGLASLFAALESVPLLPSRNRRLRAAGWFYGLTEREKTLAVVREALWLKHRYLFDSMRYPLLSEERIEGRIQLQGEDHLREALLGERGVILLTAHYGQNQDLMPALGYRGYQVHQVGSRPEDWHRLVRATPSSVMKRVFAFRQALDESLPATFLYIDRSMRPAYRCLSQGGVLVMAFDGRAGSRWLRWDILGHTMNVNVGALALARRTGAPVVPAFSLRQGSRRVVQLEAPIVVQRDEDEDAEIAAALGRFAEVFEAHLRRWPAGYAGLVDEALRRAPLDEVPLFPGESLPLDG